MAYSTLASSFVKIGTVAAQAITGVGFQPKALFIFSSYTATNNVLAENWWLSYMVTDGVTTFGRSSMTNNYNAGPAVGTAGFSYQANALPVIGISGGGTSTLKALATLTSLDADGFTLNWTTNDGGTTQTFFYLALGGTDFTGVKLLAFTPNGRIGHQSVTGMGFRPNAVLFFPGFSTSFPATGGSAAHHSFGVGLSAQEQWALAGWAKGTGSRPAYATRYQRDDRCLIIQPDVVSTASDSFFDGTDRTLETEAAFVSRDLDGFTIDWKQTQAARTIYALGLKGGRYRAGAFLKLQGSQSQPITMAFQPSFLLMATDGRHEDIIDVTAPVIEKKLSLGVKAGANSFCIGLHEQDGAGRTGGTTYPVNVRTMSTDVVRIVEAAAPLASASVLASAAFTSFNTDGFTIAWTSAFAIRRQLLYLVGGSLALASACTGGGAAPTITDPPSTDSSITAAKMPIVFVEVELDAGTKRYAKVPIADAPAYYVGFKEGRILSMGPIKRSLSGMNGDFSTASTTITLDDTDRALRTLEAAGTLMNRRLTVYVVDDTDRRAGNLARRVGSFVIRRWKADADLTFTLELDDWFGSQLGEFDLGKLIPQNTFSKSIFSDLPDALVGVAEPLVYGSMSDESNGTDAIGAVPVYFTGQETVNAFLWDRYVVCGHAIKSIQSWFASDLGVNPTGQPRRIKMPAATEGVDFLIPGNAGWLAHTGSANTYRTFGGRRYTVIYARGPRSDAAKTGGIPITLNVCGVEATGDGSGTMIDSLPAQIQHALNNQVLQNYLTGNWLTVPSMNGYSKLANITAVTTIAAARVAGGYKGAFILGGAGGQMTVAEFIKHASQSADVQFGINRHGQLAMSMENPSGAAVATITDVTDVDAQGLALEVGWDDLANKVPYRYARAYTPPAGPSDTAIPWAVDSSILDGAAVTAHLQTKTTAPLELALVQDTTTGDDVVARVLVRRTGGAAPYRGPVYATLKGGLNYAAVDLGDIVSVTHFAGLGASGWATQKARVMGVDLDPETWGITLRVMKL